MSDFLPGLDGHYEDRPCNSEKCKGKTTRHLVGNQQQIVHLSGGTIDWLQEHDDCCECHYTVHTTIHKVVIRKESA